VSSKTKQTSRTVKHVSFLKSVPCGAAKGSIKLGKSAKQSARYVHTQSLGHVHQVLSNKLSWYRRWHEWNYHKQVHYAIVVSYTISMCMALLSMHLVHASGGNWIQTNWSGGVGSSTTNQYSSAINATTSTANQVTQTVPPNLFQNTSFETNLNNWQGGLLPSSISGLTAWYKADSISGVSNGGSVTAWSDSSGNNHNLSQNTTSAEPVYEISDIGGQPAVRFNGSTNYMSGGMSGFTNASTVLSVQTVRQSVTGGTYEFGVNSGVNTGISLLPWGGTMYARSSGIAAGDMTWAYTAPTTNIITQEYNGGTNSGQAWQDSVSKGTDSTSSSYGGTINTLTVGALTPTNYFEPTDLGELIAYNVALTSSQRQSIEAYLENKYGLSNAQYVTSSHDSTVAHTGSDSVKLISGTSGGDYVQYVNTGNTSTYNLVTYVYKGGSAVTSSVAQLYYNGSAITTTYTSVGSGWYKLSASVNGINASTPYGVYVAPSQTINVDDFSLQLPASNGTLTSNIYDTGVAENYGNLSYSATVPTNTTVSVLVRAGNQPDLSDALAFTSCGAISSGSDITSSCAPDKSRYVQYQLQFTSDGSATPIFSSITIPYTPSDITSPPTNASALAMKSSPSGSSVSSNAWTNAATPYFSWTAGADDGGGSGIKGYCLYLGTDNTADPVTTKGLLGTSPVDTGGACQFAVSGTNIDLATAGYIGATLSTSNSAYYLSVKAIDNANNVYSGSNAQFHFRFDNTPPANPSFITAPSQFIATKDVTLTWPTSGSDAASDANSGLAGLQYRIGIGGTWYGANHTGSQDATDLLVNNGSYETVNTPDFANLTDGNNIVYFRTWDSAGNISSAYVTTVIKINTNSPSSPQNVTATPTTNTINAFSFSWLAPATFTGSGSNLTYCYTVNALPNSNNCTFTAPGVTSLPTGAYATQPGTNTLYVVAKDEAGNINYATTGSIDFTANTSAPGIPLNADVADISVKSSQNWKLTVSWETPTDTGAGIASYKVYRSTDNTSFSQIASTSGTSYVDSGLTQQTYYYKVKACDSANNCGAFTAAVSKFPTGKFTSAANLIANPSVTVSTRTAQIEWVTDRTSDSRVAFGTASGVYFSTEAAQSDQVKSHRIDLNNLTPGTTYYYKAQWIDEDGNLGSSSELTFTTQPAPTISDVAAIDVNVSGATIKFSSLGADSVKIYYGKSKDFGGIVTVNTSTSASTYTVPLEGLDDGAQYFFKINPFDLDGNEYDDPISLSFTTPARPHITNLQFQPVANEPTSTQLITWTTNVPASTQISYGPTGQGKIDQINTTLTTDHQMKVSDLLDDTSYSLFAVSRDATGNLATSDEQIFHTALDTRPPKITNVTIETSVKGNGAEGRGQIIVSWKTDEPATSQVAYGEGSGSTYNSKTSEDDQLGFDHTVVVSDLATSKVYHVQPVSHDKAGNVAKGTDQSAIIGQATDNVLTIILNSLQKVFGL